MQGCSRPRHGGSAERSLSAEQAGGLSPRPGEDLHRIPSATTVIVDFSE